MNNKKMTAGITALLVIAVLGIGVTLALLTDTTEVAQNVFTSNKNISILLREPAWDGYEFSDAIPMNVNQGKVVNPSITDLAKQEALGKRIAEGYVPGDVIPKNPKVKNNGDGKMGNVSVYTALKVEYYGASSAALGDRITAAAFTEKYLQSGGLKINTPYWTRIRDSISTSPCEYYIYKGTGLNSTSTGSTRFEGVLSPNEETQPLFENVPIRLDMEVDAEGKLPLFNIHVTAYAIQSNNLGKDTGSAFTEAKTQLLKLAELTR